MSANNFDGRGEPAHGSLSTSLVAAARGGEPCAFCGQAESRPFELHGMSVESRRSSDAAFVCGGCAVARWSDAFVREVRDAFRRHLASSPIAELALPEMAEVFLTEPNPNYPTGMGFVVFGQLRVFLNDPLFPLPERAERIFILFSEVSVDGLRRLAAVSSNEAPSAEPCAMCGERDRTVSIGVRGRYDEVTLDATDHVCWRCVDERIPALAELYVSIQRSDRAITGALEGPDADE